MIKGAVFVPEICFLDKLLSGKIITQENCQANDARLSTSMP